MHLPCSDALTCTNVLLRSVASLHAWLRPQLDIYRIEITVELLNHQYVRCLDFNDDLSPWIDIYHVGRTTRLIRVKLTTLLGTEVGHNARLYQSSVRRSNLRRTNRAAALIQVNLIRNYGAGSSFCMRRTA